MSSKKLKRFLSVALSLSMVFSMNVTSFAADAAIPAAPNAVVDETSQAPADEDTSAVQPESEDTEAPDAEAPADAENPSDDPAPDTPHEHDWQAGAVLKPADCKTDTAGIQLYTCTGCTETKYESLTAKHTAGASTIITAPTCVKAGVRSTTCSVCGDTYEEEIAATGKHDYAQQVTAATCISLKTIKMVCRTCGYVDEGQTKTEGSLADHSYTVKVTQPATCTEAGSQTLTCSVCKDTKTEAIPALGGSHTEVEIPAVAATCKDTGMTAGKKCSICGKITVEPQVSTEAQPAHKEIDIPAVPGNCTNKGMTAGKKCSVCGTVTEAPTETAIDKETHVWSDNITILKPPANCEDTGIGLYTCTICGKSQYQTIDDGHAWDHGTVTKPATCGEAGVKTFHCSKCNETKTEAIPATGNHNFVEGTSPATCTQPAKVGKVCSVCKQADGEAKPVNGSKPLDHEWDTGKITTEPTCDAAGVKTFTCTRKGCDGGTDGKPATKTEPVAATHKWNEGTVTKAPTCTEDGAKTVTCQNPDCPNKANGTAHTETITIPKLGHSFEEKTIPATCYHKTRVGMICKNCSAPQDENGKWIEFGELAAHVYESKVTTQATCTTDGVLTKTCKNCEATFEGEPVAGHEVTETIKASHDWNDWVVDKAATCTEKGSRHRTCKVCNAAGATDVDGYETEETPVTHAYDKGTIKQAQTCGDSEITLYTCTKCPAETPGHTTEEETKKATGKHNYADLADAATCTTPLRVGELCTVCKQAKPGTEITTIGTPLGHDLETKYTAPTCTENGKSSVTCKRQGCTYKETLDLGSISSEQATGHKAVAVEDVEATCTAGGTTGVMKCDVCKEIVNAGTKTEIDPTKHNYVIVKELLAATCTEDGAAKYECSLCHKEDGVKFDVIPAGHKYNDGVVTKPATCLEKGVKTFTCTNTGCAADAVGHIKTEDIDAIGHEYDDGAVTTQATCGKDGVKTFTCTNAGCTAETTGHTKTEKIPATGKHDFKDSAKAATCTEPVKVGSFCTVCGEADGKEQSIGSALGHDLEIKYIAPTCASKGISREACKRCDYTHDTELDLPGEEQLKHTPEKVDAVPATCGTKGTTAGTRCSVCKETLTGMEEIDLDADNHVYEVVNTLVPATCTTDGAGKVKCKYCKYETYDVIPASHTWDEEHPVIVAATCVKDGSKTFHCTACDEGEKTETITKTGHTYDDGVVTTAATCVKAGVRTFTCTNAGCTAETTEHTKTEVIPATNRHNYQEGTIPATCTEPLKVGSFCTVCKQPNGTTSTVGDPLGHDLSRELTEATCEEGVKSIETCSRCDYTNTVDLSSLPGQGPKGHTPVSVKEVPATCSTKGTTAGTQCSVCKRTLTGMTEIPVNPDAHEYKLENALIEPTCTASGAGKYVCPCGASKYVEIPADPVNGHNYVDGVCQNNCGKKAASATTNAASAVIDGANKVTFENNIQVVDQDATVVEMGILYITAADYAGVPETDLTISSASSAVRKQSTTESGTGYRFSLKVGANVDRKLYARGYITITDKAGKTQTYYGDVVSGSYNDFLR